jgi:phenylacetic acid degradation operon negative regulatory protein
LFDLYGDHLRSSGGQAPVAALVRIMAPLDIAAPAVRTAVSRMVAQGWLDRVRLPGGPGYVLTGKARARLDEAATRIYRTRRPDWDGQWDLLVLEPVRQRAARERIRAGLAFLGYARLSDSTWISPRASAGVDPLLTAEKAGYARLRATDSEPALRAAQAWDLEALATAYDEWLVFARRLVASPGDGIPDDEHAFAVRSVLVHEWRKFLFVDPGLADELLPARWPGRTAATYFDEQAARLLPAARRFIDTCLAQTRTSKELT